MNRASERIGVLVVNFGEPGSADLREVEPFLERIFLQNAGLEPSESARARARELARDRAPGLVEEYRKIGGSPLNRQADAQTEALRKALVARGWDVRAYSAFQFTDPGIGAQLAAARADGIETLVALPLYPICGQSTTVAALETVRRELTNLDWRPRFVGISGWHHRRDYVAVRVENIRAFVAERGLDLCDEETLLYFSVHGTPLKYLVEGNRYDRYVDEQCRQIAEALSADRYAVGFQNHTNRRIAWTQPDNEDRIREARERRLVVVPISFMHEQSETLAELDHEIRAFVEGLGKEFHRVPVPHGSGLFTGMLADLVEQLVGSPGQGEEALAPCRCASIEGVWCTNGTRELPESPFVPTAAP